MFGKKSDDLRETINYILNRTKWVIIINF
jgi:hypothetical protein